MKIIKTGYFIFFMFCIVKHEIQITKTPLTRDGGTNWIRTNHTYLFKIVLYQMSYSTKIN